MNTGNRGNQSISKRKKCIMLFSAISRIETTNKKMKKGSECKFKVFIIFFPIFWYVISWTSILLNTDLLLSQENIVNPKFMNTMGTILWLPFEIFTSRFDKQNQMARASRKSWSCKHKDAAIMWDSPNNGKGDCSHVSMPYNHVA